MKEFRREISLGIALIGLLLGLLLFAPTFFQARPLLSLATREAPVLLVAAGMVLIIISRQIDISVGSQFAICGVCAGLVAALKWPLVFVVLLAMLVGMALGALNGVLVAAMRLPAIVVTLATMVAWREALRWQRQGEFVNLPPGVQWFGLSQTQGQIAILILVVTIFAALGIGMHFLGAGRFIYAVGSDAEAARLTGLHPQWVTFLIFVTTGALTGLAAALNVAQSPQVDPKSGTGLELKVIAAVVIGGVSISGGRGRLWGAFLGLLLLACVGPALIHLHIEAYWERAIQGAIILLAVISEGFRPVSPAG